jgi:hypothetical protein
MAMNRIVREHYPVERLPEDLREHFPDASVVTVSVAEEEASPDPALPPLTIDEAIRMMRDMQRRSMESGKGVSPEEAVRRIRELRDEWDD